jgi:hypothetical protein
MFRGLLNSASLADTHAYTSKTDMVKSTEASRCGCPSLISYLLAGHVPMEIGTAVLRIDWLDGRWLENW